jgi:hypothetical protein
MRGRRALVLAATAAMFLAACGGGESSGSDGDVGGSADDPRNSPLSQLMGFDVSSADQRAQELQIQQEMAQCMRSEGWEYEPVDYSSQMGDMSAEFEEQFSDPEGYGEKYGYGVVRSFESQGDLGAEFEDPNMDYVSSLTPDESESYYETLYGKQPEIADGDEFVMPSLEDQGCYGVATLAVHGENSPMTNTDMQNKINELFETSESDPQLTAAIDAWAACMRDKDPSYDWDRPEDAANSFWDRLNELQGFGSIDGQGEGGSTGAVVTETFGSGDEVSGGMPEIDEADLEALRQEEISTWRDDWDCQQEAEIADVRREVEQRIVDELLAEFPELADS